MKTPVTKREVLDAIRRGLLACRVDHDDIEFFASHVLEELQKAAIVLIKYPEACEPDYPRRQEESEIARLGLEGGEPVE